MPRNPARQKADQKNLSCKVYPKRANVKHRAACFCAIYHSPRSFLIPPSVAFNESTVPRFTPVRLFWYTGPGRTILSNCDRPPVRRTGANVAQPSPAVPHNDKTDETTRRLARLRLGRGERSHGKPRPPLLFADARTESLKYA